MQPNQRLIFGQQRHHFKGSSAICELRERAPMTGNKARTNVMSKHSLHHRHLCQPGLACRSFCRAPRTRDSNSAHLFRRPRCPMHWKGHDVEGQAQTGTGKSAAFLLATMNHLMGNPPAKDGHKPWRPSSAHIRAHPRAGRADSPRTRWCSANTRACASESSSVARATSSSARCCMPGSIFSSARRGAPVDYLKQRIYSLNSIQVVGHG